MFDGLGADPLVIGLDGVVVRIIGDISGHIVGDIVGDIGRHIGGNIAAVGV